MSKVAQGLRELADFLEANPKLKVKPHSFTVMFYVWEKAELAKVARQYAPVEKRYKEDYFQLIKHFGPLEIVWFADRNQVCKQVVVGTKEVTRPRMVQQGTEIIEKPKMVQDGEETVIEEIKEWRCEEALLAPAPALAAVAADEAEMPF